MAGEEKGLIRPALQLEGWKDVAAAATLREEPHSVLQQIADHRLDEVGKVGDQHPPGEFPGRGGGQIPVDRFQDDAVAVEVVIPRRALSGNQAALCRDVIGQQLAPGKSRLNGLALMGEQGFPTGDYHGGPAGQGVPGGVDQPPQQRGMGTDVGGLVPVQHSGLLPRGKGGGDDAEPPGLEGMAQLPQPDEAVGGIKPAGGLDASGAAPVFQRLAQGLLGDIQPFDPQSGEEGEGIFVQEQ
ncbi:MAG: hypothetical protein DBY34_06670 [Oscillospiraceae bacterium]|nr:MAG: hypothetical protein DBY34_06670 [Oscillospiraceae bacterium]